jgi:Flp pilus assembly protein CpaB
MSRRRGWTFFVVGLILALGTGVMAFYFLQQQAVTAAEQSRQEALEKYAPPPTLNLPVAARPLVPGTTISKSDYVIKSFPLDLVPIAAISDTVNLDNKVVVRPIGQGETFHTGQFLGGEGSSISQQIKKGYVLFAFPVEDLMTKSDVIKDGDHIDLNVSTPLAALNDDGSANKEKDLGYATTLTLQNIEVFKVLRSAKSEDGKDETAAAAPVALLFSVSPADALLLKYAKDSENAIIDFTLRSPVDSEPFTAPWIDRPEFSRRYLTPR